MEVITDMLIAVALLIVGKTLYEDTIVLDKITMILLGVFLLLEVIFQTEPRLEFIGTCICWCIIIYCFLRGGRKGLFRRVAALVEIFFGLQTSLVMFSALLVWMLAPEWSIPYIRSGTMPAVAVLCLSALLLVSVLYLYIAIYRKGIFLNLKILHRLLLLIFSVFADVLTVFVSESILSGKFMEIIPEIRGLFFICIVLAYLVFPIMLVKGRLSEYYRKGQEYQKEWIELELAHFAEYEAQQENTRRFRHDIMNNLSCIDALLQEERWEEARKYVDVMLGEVESFAPGVVTGNRMLDCIVSMKQKNMESRGIEFSMQGVLDGGISWESFDICAVFANALDNAVEACLRLPEDVSGWVHLTFRRTDSFYFVELANAMCAKEHHGGLHKRFTTKENKELHGYGMENMRRTLEKYGGSMKVDMKDAQFILTMMIPV